MSFPVLPPSIQSSLPLKTSSFILAVNAQGDIKIKELSGAWYKKIGQILKAFFLENKGCKVYFLHRSVEKIIIQSLDNCRDITKIQETVGKVSRLKGKISETVTKKIINAEQTAKDIVLLKEKLGFLSTDQATQMKNAWIFDKDCAGAKHRLITFLSQTFAEKADHYTAALKQGKTDDPWTEALIEKETFMEEAQALYEAFSATADPYQKLQLFYEDIHAMEKKYEKFGGEYRSLYILGCFALWNDEQRKQLIQDIGAIDYENIRIPRNQQEDEDNVDAKRDQVYLDIKSAVHYIMTNF